MPHGFCVLASLPSYSSVVAPVDGVLITSSTDKPWARWRRPCGRGWIAGSRSSCSQASPSSTTRACRPWPRPSTWTPPSWAAELRLSTSSCPTTWTTWTRVSSLELCNVRLPTSLSASRLGIANEPLNTPRPHQENPKTHPHENLDLFMLLLRKRLCLLSGVGRVGNDCEWLSSFVSCILVNSHNCCSPSNSSSMTFF